MPRLPRLHVPGGIYRVTLSGNHRRNIFFTADDRLLLEKFVAEALKQTRTRLHAYCWLPNQIQLLIQVADVPLGQFMQRIGSRYARTVQKRLQTTGHLFESRYEALLVDASEYFVPLLQDIHLGPVHAGIASRPDRYRWSSHGDYLGKRSRSWVTVDFGLALLHPDRDRARMMYQALMSSTPRSVNERAAQAGAAVDPRVLGSADFVSSLSVAPLATQERLQSTLTLESIARELCRDYGVTREQLRSVRQTRSLSRVRGLIAARALEQRVATLAEVSRFLNRSASALSRAVERYDR